MVTDKNISEKIEAGDSLLSSLGRRYMASGRTLCDEQDIATYSNDNIRYFFKKVDDSIAIKTLEGIRTDITDPQFFLETNNDTSQLLITVAYKDKYSAQVFTITMSYKFAQFLEPVLQPGLFEHYVVFYKGKSVYQDFRSSLGYKVVTICSTKNTVSAVTKYTTLW